MMQDLRRQTINRLTTNRSPWKDLCFSKAAWFVVVQFIALWISPIM